MHREAIQAKGVPPALGPYSSGVVCNNIAYLSGQGPLDAEGNIVSSEIGAQTRQTLQNLAMVANAAGADLKNALHVRVYLANMDDFAGMNAVYAEFFEAPYPARTTVQSGLPKAGMLVEIDAVVAIPD